MKKNILISLIIVLFMISSAVAQEQLGYEDEDVYILRKQAGFVLSVAESGTGIGGFIGWPVENNFHIGLTFDAFFLRDTDQIDYVDYYYQVPVSLNKINNVYIFDLFATIKKRLFVEDLHDSFQPFVTATAGPVFGMNFPERETELKGVPTREEYRWTLGGYFGAGVDITSSVKYFFSLRGQYVIMPFSKILGERANHSMFEIRLEIGYRY